MEHSVVRVVTEFASLAESTARAKLPSGSVPSASNTCRFITAALNDILYVAVVASCLMMVYSTVEL